MLIFSETEYNLNTKEIEDIENYLGLIFPIEYKEHLLLHNGGKCIPNIFDFNENGVMTSSSIDWFLAIYDGEYDNLKNYIEIYKKEEKRLPSHIVPFAHDAGGNLICISCGNKDLGSIFFWNHEAEVNYDVSNDDDYSNIYFIAESFKQFIEILH